LCLLSHLVPRNSYIRKFGKVPHPPTLASQSTRQLPLHGLHVAEAPHLDHHHQYLTSCSRGRRQAGDPAKQGTSASCPPLSISASAKRTSFSEGADRLFATCVVCSLVPSARPSCLPLLSRPRCNHLSHQESPSFRRYQCPHVFIDALPRIQEGLFFFFSLNSQIAPVVMPPRTAREYHGLANPRGCGLPRAWARVAKSPPATNSHPQRGLG
jgi:hypothetical protein